MTTSQLHQIESANANTTNSIRSDLKRSTVFAEASITCNPCANRSEIAEEAARALVEDAAEIFPQVNDAKEQWLPNARILLQKHPNQRGLAQNQLVEQMCNGSPCLPSRPHQHTETTLRRTTAHVGTGTIPRIPMTQTDHNVTGCSPQLASQQSQLLAAAMRKQHGLERELAQSNLKLKTLCESYGLQQCRSVVQPVSKKDV